MEMPRRERCRASTACAMSGTLLTTATFGSRAAMDAPGLASVGQLLAEAGEGGVLGERTGHGARLEREGGRVARLELERALAGGVRGAVLVGDLVAAAGQGAAELRLPGMARVVVDDDHRVHPLSPRSPCTWVTSGRPKLALPRDCISGSEEALEEPHDLAGVDPDVRGHPAIPAGPLRRAVTHQVAVAQPFDRARECPEAFVDVVGREELHHGAPGREREVRRGPPRARRRRTRPRRRTGPGPPPSWYRDRSTRSRAARGRRAGGARCRRGGCASCHPGRHRGDGGAPRPGPGATARAAEGTIHAGVLRFSSGSDGTTSSSARRCGLSLPRHRPAVRPMSSRMSRWNRVVWLTR